MKQLPKPCKQLNHDLNKTDERTSHRKPFAFLCVSQEVETRPGVRISKCCLSTRGLDLNAKQESYISEIGNPFWKSYNTPVTSKRELLKNHSDGGDFTCSAAAC